MKAKKAIAILLALVLALSLCPAMSFAADDGTADSALSFTDDWSYDAENDVYYVIGIPYCTEPADETYNNMAIYVPGAYMRGESINGYTADTAPIAMPVNTGAYMAMKPPTSYNYNTVSSYIEAGYVYMFAGCRGQNSGNGYDHAPWGVADMKAAVRYMRLNDSVIPGDSERIVTFGHSGGGALSSVMGASGDAAEYYPYLASLGAAGIEYDGTDYTSTISDAVYGSMCWCPITELTGADMAYEWFLGQYIDSTEPTIWIEGFRSWILEENDSPRYEGLWTSMLSDDLAAGYAEYVNALGLTDEDGNALKLEASDEGIYLAGSYYEYMVDVVNTSLNNFIEDHGGIDDFYYYSYSENPYYNPEKPTEAIASKEYGPCYTVEDYFDEVIGDGWDTWIAKVGDTYEVTSLEGFVNNWKTPNKSVGAFDNEALSTNEVSAFGNSDNKALHFDSYMYDILVANADKYKAAYPDAADEIDALIADFKEDFALTDDLGGTMETRTNMYNPLYYIANSEDGESNVAKHWRINTGIQQNDTASTVEVNLYLALLANEDVDSVSFATVWDQSHVQAERTGTSTENLIAWIAEICPPAEPVSLDLAAAIADGTYKWELLTDESGDYYQLSNVVYCANPTDDYYDDEHYFQSIVIIVPTEYLNADGTVNNSGVVNGYTAETAPIIVKNNCQGWMSSKPTTANDDSVITYRDYIDNGFIYIGCGARSRNIDNGTAPAPIVDIKAAIRFIRLNDDAIPGTSEKLVSMGGSGAGEMSSVIGASGNMSEYYSYLYAIGAAGIDLVDGEYVSTISDAVDACMAFYPIGDIENADMAYSWLRFDSGETGLTKRGVTTEFTEFQLALQNDLAAAFCEYVNGLQLTNEDGTVLTLTSARDGSYYDQILQNLSDALNKYLAYYGEEATEELIVGYSDTEDWLVKNDDGTYSVTNISGMLNGTGLARNKDITGFDAFDLSAENNAFGTIAEGKAHYSMSVATVLKENYGKYSDFEGFDKESVDNFIAVLERDDIAQQTYLMNATTIMLNAAAGEQETDIAPYWRIRSGTADQHTSSSVGYNMALAAMANDGIDVDYSLVWNMVHGNEIEGESAGTFLGWVEEIFPATSDDSGSTGGGGSGHASSSTNTSTTTTTTTTTTTDTTFNTTPIEIAAEPVMTEEEAAAAVEAMTDVEADAYYEEAVKWAVENGITTGTSDTTFSPDAECTRAQIVTFLYRAAGSPAVTGSANFADVDGDAYYAAAVAWAVEAGITNGTGDTTFSPDDVCTRAQIVTLLHRFAGQADANGDHDFDDVHSSAYYSDAVAWAVNNGITNGTGDGTFSPDNGCTRGQVVTFLYRYATSA